MIFKYGETELEDGRYIVELTYKSMDIANKQAVEITVTKREIAECYDNQWMQTGVDYDVWQYDRSFKDLVIDVKASIHLDDCTLTEM
ncbi:hypothetical protein HYP99_gp028 [Sinorhizobium phage ort11]|uniref:Uncharacterized protein n=1 Tax=Sinorhizobium phage ort11 TaxID=2599764 RepID=A0A5C2H2W6_9CAUD|nr:hypothetical protein HYP99_gp028 [Sinorhizobium phage ort11]QEP29826.1 hypothetical protein Smphiort11_028 [Sinorhizobium phage ort11]